MVRAAAGNLPEQNQNNKCVNRPPGTAVKKYAGTYDLPCTLDPAVIEQARQMDLLSYLQRYEPDNLKHVARNVYCTREHDSLKISNGKWYWWSRGFGGVSALDYLIKVKEYSFVEAVEALSGITAGWSPPPVSVPKDEPKELLLPPRNKDRDRVIQYLFGRGIDFQIIQECIADGTIYESLSKV